VPRVSGVLPSGRSHHAWAMANGRLYLFGGASTDSGGAVPLNDVFALTPHGTHRSLRACRVVRRASCVVSCVAILIIVMFASL
jgi:hypothetical protein